MDYMAGGGDVLQAAPAPAPGPSSRHYSARCGGGDEEEEEEEYVEIILDRRHGSMAGHGAEPAPGGGGGDDDDDDDSEEVTVPAQALENSSGIDRSDPATARVLKALDFIRGIGGEVAAAEKFFDELSQDGRLHRSEFGQCIGTEEVELAGELFDALANRRTISCDSSISKAELLVFCDQISHQRLRIFFDMVGKNTGVRITEEEVKQIILLRSIRRSPANEQSTRIEEQARWIMEDLDPNNLGHIELDNLEMELLPARIQSEGIGMTTDRRLSRMLSQRLRPTWEPNPLRRWCRPTLYFLEDNWRRVWVILLWLAVLGGLFAWKFVQYRRRAVFEVMGYCVCVGKGGAETLKFNMALVLLPVCRNTITWVRDCAAVARVVPFNDSLSFHKVISVGVAVGAGLHITSQMACNFPRLLHATDAVYAPVAQFYGTPRPPNYWWFLKGTEGWTGIVMVVLMSVAFTLATPWFRRGRIRLSGPLRRLAGFNSFWYTHHLFVVVYALLILHGHSLYLSNKWYKKTTWMYLAVPMLLYSCERLTRVLRSSVRPVKVLKVAVYPGNVMVLCFSKPPGFRYKSGQYILLNCATVSAFQWHPFYLTSAPQDDYLSVHIRTLGDWTRQLRSVFSLVLRPPTDGESGLLLFDHDGGAMSNQSPPKVLIDGPYGAPWQDYKKYDIVLLIGLGIGVTPMISIIKDIINNIKQLKGDLESGSGGDEIGNSTSSFRMQRVYFYWVTREQGSFEWFRDVMDDVAETDKGIIDVQVYCTNEYTKEGKHSALTLMLQSLSHAKHGFVSGTRVKTHFARPNWRNVYKRIAVNHGEQHVGVFYCGAPVLEQEMRELAQDFSRKTSTKFEFHKENF